MSMSTASMLRPALRIALLVPLFAAACGGDEDTADREALAQGAGDVTTALEYAVGGMVPLTEVDFTRGTSPEAIDAAVKAINDLPGDCVVAAAAMAPAVGMSLAFSGSGLCGLLPVKGSLSVSMTQMTGSTRLDASFVNFVVDPVRLDGSLALTKQSSAFSYDFNNLKIGYGDHDVEIDGAGSFTRSIDRTQVVFNGTGTLRKDGHTFAFTADKVTRRYVGDCYPSSGTLVITYTSPSKGVKITATIRFDNTVIGSGVDSDSTGKVYLDFNGKTQEYQLPKRAICG